MSRARARFVPCIAGLLTLVGAGVIPAASASAKSSPLGGRALRQGSSGPDVRALQADLSRAGFAVAASGSFGPRTTRELESFQRFYRLRSTGVADRRLMAQLGTVMRLDANEVDATTGSGGSGLGGPTIKSKGIPKVVKRTTHVPTTTNDPTSVLNDPVLAPVAQDGGSQHLGERPLKQGMKGHDVRVLQSYLTLAGYPTSVDGDFGPTTKASLVKFEQANSLAADGVMTYAQSLSLRQDVAKAITATGAVGTPTLSPSGAVTAPSGAPQAVQEMIAAANSITSKPYIYGGGHGRWNDAGYDCSGSVSFVLHAAGLLSSSEDSTGLESYGSSGPGKWVTIYANAGHTWIVIAGLAFDTAHYGPTTPGGTGPRWLIKADATANLVDHTGGYVVRHPTGL